MKKFFLSSVLLAMLSFQSPAQFLLGPQAGINFATITGTSFSVSSKPGWNAGFFISIPINKHFSIMPAALYSMRGFKYSYDSSITTTTTPNPDTTITVKNVVTANVDATIGYLDVPVLFTYFTQETKGFMIQAGPQISFLINDQSTVSTTATTTVTTNGGNPQTTTSNPTNTNNVSFQKSDISLIGGIGYKFPQLLILYARVSTGLAKAQSGSYVSDSNTGHNFVFEAGAALSFGGK